ncbi:MAG: sigma-70 family RNA polymerase sigma factor, partial [Actinomycetota bacterium]|nr:sigma-70 family RNA polymerase sigma factor [Actinomycetota bacterium]
MPARGGRPLGASRRLLALAGDRRLADLVRAGNEAAFEVVFERHGPPLLSFCRQMLGSHEEAEDAVQQTFDSAHRALVGSDRPVELKPWLFTIARNRCLSILRARRPDTVPIEEHAVAGLAEEVERRADLRELLRDLADLPEQQRAALVLFELGDLSHEQIAEVIGCEAPQVKGIVFRARAGLTERREGRHAPCEEIREDLATLRRGSLRRSRLRHHLRECPACAAFREDVRRQRAQMAILLPVIPSAGLKAAVLGAVGSGGGLAGAGVAGSGALAKLALVGVMTAGVGGAGIAIEERRGDGADRKAAETAPRPAGNGGALSPATLGAGTEGSRHRAAAGGAGAGRNRGAPKASRGERRSARSLGQGPASRPARRGRSAPKVPPRGRREPKIAPPRAQGKQGPP